MNRSQFIAPLPSAFKLDKLVVETMEAKGEIGSDKIKKFLDLLGESTSRGMNPQRALLSREDLSELITSTPVSYFTNSQTWSGAIGTLYGVDIIMLKSLPEGKVVFIGERPQDVMEFDL